MVNFNSHWLVRTDDGKIKVFTDEPKKNENNEWFCEYDGENEYGMYLRGYEDEYDNVKKENSPVEVHFITPSQFMFYSDMY